MLKFKPNQYYGYFDYEPPEPTFHVVLIKPSKSHIHEWIGSKNVKLSDLLCIDDYILSNCPFRVDWSRVNEH